MISQRQDEPVRHFACRIDVLFRSSFSEYCDKKTMRQFKRKMKINWLRNGVSNCNILDLIRPSVQSEEEYLSWPDYVEAVQDAEWHYYLLHPKYPRKSVSFHNQQDFEIDDDGYAIVCVGGSCLNDGKSDAEGAVGVWFSDDHELNTSAPLANADNTNFNACQISAVIEAIKIAIDNDIERLSVYTSSRFVIDCMGRFLRKWLWNGWKRVDGELVRNRWQYRYLLELMEDTTVKFVHVELNNACSGNDGRSEYESGGEHDTENVSEEDNSDYEEEYGSEYEECSSVYEEEYDNNDYEKECYSEYEQESNIQYESEYKNENSVESEEEDFDTYGVKMASYLANLALKN